MSYTQNKIHIFLSALLLAAVVAAGFFGEHLPDADFIDRAALDDIAAIFNIGGADGGPDGGAGNADSGDATPTPRVTSILGEDYGTDEWFRARQDFDRELTEEEIEREQASLERALRVTYNNALDLDEGVTAGYIELTVASVEFQSEFHSQRGYKVHEIYELLGQDDSGVYWFMYITREHVSTPDPTARTAAGEKITVYGRVDGSEFIDEVGQRAHKLSLRAIDYHD